MCRFIAYLGKPFVLHDLLYKPVNSLIKQSIHAQEMEHPLNGDGFGISWYVKQLDEYPGVFKSIQPAWNDSNLETLSTKIFSGCILAHVRAASRGDVNIFNTHPFIYKEYCFMHNGIINGFDKLRRQVTNQLSDEIYHWIKGQTDSELFFAVFLDFLIRSKKTFDIHVCADLVRKTLDYIETLQQKSHIKEMNFINAVISNGKTLLAMRYVSNKNEKTRSLHYAIGSGFKYQDGYCHMGNSENQAKQSVLIASEQLTSHKVEWHNVPTNHLILVDEAFQLEIQSI
ncbi:class II glutamine amidotransferase [Legionella micdadei]|uniref:Glutamine amidotransferase n=1 Tax=Legionella micdadei TaxID=451 RepID=A0A098GJ64_LEGMI|nr:class II glutamine amidotransferase [Legionella micdadei]ARG97043.1 class II glutamine amidotransferase [Legionella micdadei]ARH00702.1 class II glutamine amidotransferase [Legionella micdadei]KTD26761.1 glutamine amidotransferase [Legionella micdadei]NSL18265.1 class II glutamine amidotransferase [Legionella micdadei]CEG61541.1 Glutamine amidotransferase [Legionella micdadei]